MAPVGDDTRPEPTEPRALRHVGPATAAVLEGAPFDAADIQARRVSLRALVEAGVNPGVAERLRREYGLLWAYRWHHGGEDLPRRAANLRGAGAGERRWIAASSDSWDGRLPDDDRPAEPRSTRSPPDFDDLEWPDWPEPSGRDRGHDALAAALEGAAANSDCPRCGADLSRFVLGEQESVLCDACGYAGVAVAHGGDDAWQTAVDRLVRGRTTSRRG